jgi:hypothetical protein
MTRPVRTMTDLPSPPEPSLFVDDAELHRRVAPHLGKDRFRAVVKVWERQNFPRVNTLLRGRYWPAVRAWLDGENGVGSNAPGSGIEDGPENFDAAPRQNPRP